MNSAHQDKIIRDKTGSVTLTLSPERYAVAMGTPIIWDIDTPTHVERRSLGADSFDVEIAGSGTFDVRKWIQRLKDCETFTAFGKVWLLVAVYPTMLSFKRMYA